VYGRTRIRRTLQGAQQERVPQDKWHTLLLDSHLGYISWDEYQENQRRLQANAHALGPERRKSPPREGPALLQGLVICGICGERMKVIYHVRAGRRVPDYICDGRTVDDPQPMCQWISGKAVDEAVGELLLEIVTPVAIEVTLAVQQELQPDWTKWSGCAKRQVERARYEAELAQRRYMRVDPDNRLVADTLKPIGIGSCALFRKRSRSTSRQRQKDCMAIDEELRSRLQTLATDFPRLWRDPNTPDRERKRLAHLLLEDVTLIKTEQLLIIFAFLEERPERSNCPSAPSDGNSTIRDCRGRSITGRSLHEAIANILNSRGSVSGYGKAFTGRMIGRREEQIWTEESFRAVACEGNADAGRDGATAWHPHQAGPSLACRRSSARPFMQREGRVPLRGPRIRTPKKAKGVRLSKRLRFENVSQRPSEVQYEA